jgi:hypothetical protein
MEAPQNAARIEPVTSDPRDAIGERFEVDASTLGARAH